MNRRRQYLQEISEIDKKYNQREKIETIQFAIIIIAIIGDRNYHLLFINHLKQKK